MACRCLTHNGHGWRCKNEAVAGSKWCDHHAYRPKGAPKRKSSGGVEWKPETLQEEGMERERESKRQRPDPGAGLQTRGSGEVEVKGFAEGDVVWLVGGLDSVIKRATSAASASQAGAEEERVLGEAAAKGSEVLESNGAGGEKKEGEGMAVDEGGGGEGAGGAGDEAIKSVTSSIVHKHCARVTAESKDVIPEDRIWTLAGYDGNG
eukprot:3932939-Rhodomonas_salina.5